jgi:DNA-binding response OmpR family regulator
MNVEPGKLEKIVLENANPKQILLIDDSEQDASLIMRKTETYNCEWTWALDYDQAVHIISTASPGFFALIFLDLRLGSYEECFRVFTHIKKRKVAPVMILSGHLDISAMSHLLKIGFAGFVQKPDCFNDEFFADLFQLVDVRPKV